LTDSFPPKRHSPAVDALRRRSAARAGRLTTNRAVRQAIVSVAGLVGAPVLNQAEQQVGKVIDVVARIHGDDRYPPVTGILVRVGRRSSFLDADKIGHVDHRLVHLKTAQMDLRDFTRRPGEVLLAKDVLDHQLVDVDGRQVIRAADLYLAPADGRIRLVGLDVSMASLVRRLGPRALRGRPTPERVIDWDAVAPFGEELITGPATVQLRAGHEDLQRLRPGELADLLEDLGRPARQELLATLDPATVADALEEMDPDELEALLREADPARAAVLVAAMEPDEAVDALRDLSEAERADILSRIPPEQAQALARLLTYRENTAGGFMTTVLVTASLTHTVGEVERIVAGFREHRDEVDAVLILDEGRLLADLPLFDLVAHPDDQLIGDVLIEEGHPEPLTVAPDASVADVAERLVENRRSSLLVVDETGAPLGRILADDVVDALLPERGRLHFPRLLQ
jgi:CBS domain-containing protein